MRIPPSADDALVAPPDFSEPPVEDIRTCPWWRPVRVAVSPTEADDPLLAAFLPDLLRAFEEQGHIVDAEASDDPDILLATVSVPEGPGPLLDRIVERERPLLVTSSAERGLRRRPPHVVALVSIAELIGDLSHEEAVDLGRVAMARVGTPRLVFVAGDRASGQVEETTVCTLEGGHPSDTSDHASVLRDRLVTAACAEEIGGDYTVVDDGLWSSAWRRTAVPDAIVKAGRRMDDLGLLPPPQRVDSYVTPRLAAIYERLLGLKGFSEGMLFAYDPETETMMVTASGSWEVDKRALRRDEVVPVDIHSERRPVRVLAPEGTSPKGPSVEAYEMLTLLQAAPRVRLARTTGGGWRPDPEGDVEAPVVRAGIHVHVGITGIDPRRVESLPANREVFPYGFGCGTDLMHDVVRDAARRSEAMRDPDDPRSFVRWPMLYHGDTLVELWRPELSEQPLEALLDLFDDGGLAYSSSHIEQPS